MDYSRHTGLLEPYTTPKEIEAKIFSVLWELKKQGKAKSTINYVRKALNFLSRHCNLDDTDSVKAFIARLDRKEGYKKNHLFSNYVSAISVSDRKRRLFHADIV